MTYLRSLDPESVTDADERMAEQARDFTNAQTEAIPEAVIDAMDKVLKVACPDWFKRVQDELESRELARLELAAEEMRMDHAAYLAEDRRYGGGW